MTDGIKVSEFKDLKRDLSIRLEAEKMKPSGIWKIKQNSDFTELNYRFTMNNPEVGCDIGKISFHRFFSFHRGGA
jgi:hypothetical protein